MSKFKHKLFSDNTPVAWAIAEPRYIIQAVVHIVVPRRPDAQTGWCLVVDRHGGVCFQLALGHHGVGYKLAAGRNDADYKLQASKVTLSSSLIKNHMLR